MYSITRCRRARRPANVLQSGQYDLLPRPRSPRLACINTEMISLRGIAGTAKHFIDLCPPAQRINPGLTLLRNAANSTLRRADIVILFVHLRRRTRSKAVFTGVPFRREEHVKDSSTKPGKINSIHGALFPCCCFHSNVMSLAVDFLANPRDEIQVQQQWCTD